MGQTFGHMDRNIQGGGYSSGLTDEQLQARRALAGGVGQGLQTLRQPSLGGGGAPISIPQSPTLGPEFWNMFRGGQ